MTDTTASSNDVQSKFNHNIVEAMTDDAFDGRSLLGFSLTSPDLVICAGSPDVKGNSYGSLFKSSEENGMHSFELSLGNGFRGGSDSDRRENLKTQSVKFSAVSQTFNKHPSPDSSFELLPHLSKEAKLPDASFPGFGINAGSADVAGDFGGVKFVEDICFVGGDTVATNAAIQDVKGDCLYLYQTARFGNFSYCIRGLESGSYAVDLHFAEIVFTNGPPGMRVFDVFVQEKKVVTCLDIYEQVGGNKPLVISNIGTFIHGEEALSIRFEGVKGSPIVCGISITKDSPANVEEAQMMEMMGTSEVSDSNSPKASHQSNSGSKSEDEYQKLLRDYEHQKQDLEDLRRENQFKNRECQDAWNSLKELQAELMRKSMHVGSLAFAIEGQVKDKSKWFSYLKDITRKLKIMKMEHIKLSEDAMEYKKYLEDMNAIISKFQTTMKQQIGLQEALKVKFIQGAKEKKELYNKVLELKGNIRIFCRCRPLNAEELATGASVAIDFESAKDGELSVTSNGLPRKTFKFDAVFGPEVTQADVFEDTAPFATSVLDGYNVCILAYGQTGTGKTFTMEGVEENRGVNYRTLEQLFHIIEEREKLYRYDVCVSVLEVYNEQIRDLLVSGSHPGAASRRLEVRQVSEGHHVPGLVEAQVNNLSEVWEVLQVGCNARAVGSTNANEYSSRSHCINCVMVKGENLLNGERTRSKLWLVDLAGSERVAKTEVLGERLKETQSINKSLSALGDVISALATKSPYIPFRNSKLTHLLQDSLGGDSKTLMFVQISPTENDLGETLCSLNFASRVRGIELGPAKRQWDTTELLKYKQMFEKSKQELKSKDVQIKKMEDTIHGLDLKAREKEVKNRNLQEKVKELESQLLIERKLARQHVDNKMAEQQQRKQQQDNRATGGNKMLGDSASGAVSKEKANLIQPFTENNCKPSVQLPAIDAFTKYVDPLEKENNPDMAEVQWRVPKKTGRASICTTVQQIPLTSAPRRNSLIPLPSGNSGRAQAQALTLLPQLNLKEITEEEPEAAAYLPEQTHCESPPARGGIQNGSSTKNLSNIIRRSIQKKMQMKTPLVLQQHLRKGGINVGTERVRMSFGSKGRMNRRLLVHGKRVETPQKQNRKEKERWNIGTGGRTTAII